MTGTQWPPEWRLHAVAEDFLENPNVAFYEARGLKGLVEMRIEHQLARVMAARTAPPTKPTPTPTKEDHHMTDVTNTRPLRALPARLDEQACLRVLAQITNAKTDSIAAAAESVTIEIIDAGLATTELSIDDRLRFKFALGQLGVVSRGRRTSLNRI